MRSEMENSAELARAITKAASLQTFSIIRLLVDHRRVDDAYRAYGYFRWVDDWLDGAGGSRSERQKFLARQLIIQERSFAGDPPDRLSEHEHLVVDLIRHDPAPGGALAAYVRNMMAVMSFDAARRGRWISQAELAACQRSLAIAVTEAMHYFIGRGQPAPRVPERYLAVTAAYITHMLRDTYEDLQAGYFNIPTEFLNAHGISPGDVDSPAYAEWVSMRVKLARQDFAAGRQYLRQVPSARCRLAAYAYTARFEIVLDLIERDAFRLRSEYSDCKTLKAGLQMAGSTVASWLRSESLSPTRGTVDRGRVSGTS